MPGTITEDSEPVHRRPNLASELRSIHGKFDECRHAEGWDHFVCLTQSGLVVRTRTSGDADMEQEVRTIVAADQRLSVASPRLISWDDQTIVYPALSGELHSAREIGSWSTIAQDHLAANLAETLAEFHALPANLLGLSSPRVDEIVDSLQIEANHNRLFGIKGVVLV